MMGRGRLPGLCFGRAVLSLFVPLERVLKQGGDSSGIDDRLLRTILMLLRHDLVLTLIFLLRKLSS